MTSVVTGASGHLGGVLVRRLLEQGETVRAVVHRNTAPLEGLDVERVKASLADEDSLRAAFRGADTVYHLAAKISIVGDPDGSVYATNVVGARNAARAARLENVGRYVHFSSVHAFDLRGHRGPIDEETPKSFGKRQAAYDRSKALGEHQVRAEVDEGLHATIVNPTGVIGPLDFGPSRMGSVFLGLQRRKLPALVSGAFDFVDVRDVARSAIAAAEKGAVGENHLLGGTRISVPDLADVASSVTGVPPPRFTMPIWVAMLGVPFARLAASIKKAEPTFTRESLLALKHGRRVDHSKALKRLGHRPRPIKQTVQDIYDWFEGR